MATSRYISATNAFIPVATGQVIAYLREPGRFPLYDYVQIVRAPKPVVAYATVDPDWSVRVKTDQEFNWTDGEPRPRPTSNQATWNWTEVRVDRRSYGYTVGEQAIEAASGWNPKALFNAGILSIAMTNITNRFITLMEKTGTWSGNTADANTLNNGAGIWTNASSDPASPNYLAIQKSIYKAVRNILLSTNGAVQVKDLKLVLCPDTAIAMAETSEVHDYLKGQVGSLAVLQGKEPKVQTYFGLPPVFHGLPVVIEDTPIVNIRANTSGNNATLDTQRIFAKSKTSAVICSRVGGIDGNYGAPSFSTFQRYVYKYDLAVEAKHNSWDKLWEAAVVDQFKEIAAAPTSGYLITNVM